MNKYELPWQVTPSLLIEHAIEHARKNTDFDKQMAYLILDVGVETTFKVFLANHAFKDLESAQRDAQKNRTEVSFHQLVELVKQVAVQRVEGVKIGQTDYFHNLRNKIYHQSDGVAPTQESLDRYLELAKELVRVLIDVELSKNEEEKSQYSIRKNERNKDWTFEEITVELKERLEYFQEDCALLIEQLHPNVTKRKFALELKNIWKDTYGSHSDSDDYDTSEPTPATVYNVEERLRLFSEAVKRNLGSQEIVDLGLDEEFDAYNESDRRLVDFSTENPIQLYVWIALQEFSLNDEDWKKYQEIVQTVESLPGWWIHSLDEHRLDNSKITQAYKEMDSWLTAHQSELISWFKEHYPYLRIPERPVSFKDIF